MSLAKLQRQANTLISSIISSTSLTSFRKIWWFLIFQMTQISLKPFLNLFLPTSIFQHSQRMSKSGGIIKLITNYLINLDQIYIVSL